MTDRASLPWDADIGKFSIVCEQGNLFVNVTSFLLVRDRFIVSGRHTEMYTQDITKRTSMFSMIQTDIRRGIGDISNRINIL